MSGFCIRAAVLLLASFPGLALAWSSAGHQQVGALADQLMVGTVAEQKVRQILGGMSLETVSVWADCAKGVHSRNDKTFVYEDDPRFGECRPFSGPDEAARFESFVQRNWKQCGTAHGSENCHNQYHYADVSEIHHEYNDGYVGANDHDVVHAIDAAIAVLRGQPARAPFSIIDQREALLMLAHYIGDLHQPLHVETIYLDGKGGEVNPDVTGYHFENDTAGGNLLLEGSSSLHHDWDSIPADYQTRGAQSAALLRTARSVPVTSGDIKTWPQSWASEVLENGSVVFAGLRFLPHARDQAGGSGSWDVEGLSAAYEQRENAFKFQQLARAGARLAQVLEAVWPGSLQAAVSTGPEACDSAKGYLTQGDLPDIKNWLPPAPAKGSLAEKADIEAYEANRKLLLDRTPRAQQAAEDDVYDAPLVLERFKEALGVRLSQDNAPTLVKLICRVEQDAHAIVRPVKLPIRLGGRVRPFVAHPDEISCLFPDDLAGHRAEDLQFNLPDTGSYPSGHALLGMIVAMILSEVSPAHADELIARGIAFGESRLICGFHYPSDLTGGRLTAAVLFARLQSSSEFAGELAQARAEVAAVH